MWTGRHTKPHEARLKDRKERVFETLMQALAGCGQGQRRERRRNRTCRSSAHILRQAQNKRLGDIGVGGPCGYDGAHKRIGRERVAWVDTEGSVLTCAAVPAKV